MAITHLHFNDQIQHGRALRRALQMLEEGSEGLFDVLATMQHQIDGDGSQVGHFAAFVTRYGFADTTAAKAAWDELNSLAAKLNTDAEVTFVKAAMLQAFAKFR